MVENLIQFCPLEYQQPWKVFAHMSLRESRHSNKKQTKYADDRLTNTYEKNQTKKIKQRIQERHQTKKSKSKSKNSINKLKTMLK
jgi:uncharacterized protein (DUF1697 family)